MEVLPGIKIIGLTLYFERIKLLVIGDMHLGLEDALNKQGILIPRTQFKEAIKSLTSVIEEVKPRKILILGDLKHEFGGISGQEWSETKKLFSFLLSKARVVVIKGNHDAMLKPIVKSINLEFKEYYSAGNCFFCHGHKLIENQALKKAKLIVIGHCHPAIGLRDEARVEKYKCFLIGKYKDKKLIVVPSFNCLTEGSDVLQSQNKCPYIRRLDNFKVIAVSDRVYDFGLVKSIRRVNQ